MERTATLPTLRSSNLVKVKGFLASRRTQGHLLKGKLQKQRLVNRGDYHFGWQHRDFLAEGHVTGK